MLHIKNFHSTILEDITFHLQQGQNLIILGANGAGKSTLAKVISGIIPSSNVTLFSQELQNLTPKQRVKLINYIPAKLDIFDSYITLQQYLLLSTLFNTKTLEEVLQLLSLNNLQNEILTTLSSGEKQLTMIASALLHNAKLTIFDEPTANLDPQKTLQVYRILKSNILENKIIITHDLNLAYKLGYKILYLKNKKIHFFDTNEIFFQQQNLQQLFGDSIIKVQEHYVLNL